MTADSFPASEYAPPARERGRAAGMSDADIARLVDRALGPPGRGRGRPAIGRPLTVRLPDELRARVAAAALPGEALAETARRLLDAATAPPAPARPRRSPTR